MIVKAPAKLNLYVQVGPRGENGYHDITTVFQAISLYDTLKISPAQPPNGLTITVEGIDSHKIPTDSRNLVIKAVKALSDHIGIEPNVHFHLEKSIPTEAGLGGGSADAAAALIGCNMMWDANVDESELLAIAVTVDEDTAFFIKGMMALGTGLDKPPVSLTCGKCTWHWVLGFLSRGLSTKEVYEKYDEVLARKGFNGAMYQSRHEHCVQTAWGSASPHLLAAELVNDLEQPAVEMLPDVRTALSVGTDAGALASLMAGAGSTCAFLAESEDHAKSLAMKLQGHTFFRKIVLATGPVEHAFIIQ